MLKRFTLISGLALTALSVFADEVVLFDAEAVGCDKNRVYMGNNWSGTLYSYPGQASDFTSSESSFVDVDKVLKITNETLKSASADSKLTFSIGWVGDNAQFQLALGELEGKANNIVECKDLSSGNTSFTVSLADGGDHDITAESAVEKLSAAGYIMIDGKNFDIVKIVYEYTPGGENPEQPDDTFSGSKEIKNLAFTFGSDWYDVAQNGADASKALWIKPAYLPDVKAGDEIQVTFGADGGQANFVYLDSDNKWQKRGDNNSIDPDWIDVISKSHTYVFKVLSETIASELAANGLWVDGKQNNVAKVVFVYNKHAEEIEGDIVADNEDDPQPPTPGNYTTRVLWETGQTITSAKGDETAIIFEDNWMSRYNVEDGGADKLEQAFHLPASLFYTAGQDEANVDLDDCIVVTLKSANSAEGAEGSFYFLDNDGVWFKRGVGNADVVEEAFSANGKVFERYILNYRTVAALRHNGMWIDGNKGSEVVKVELRNYKNEALDDSQPYFVGQIKQELNPGLEDRGYVTIDTEGNRSFGYGNLKRVRPVAFTNYSNGERIIFTFKKLSDDAELRLQYIRPYSSNLKIASGLTGTTEGILSFKDIPADENGLVKITYRPTQREIRALKFNGLFLDGKGLELNEISFGMEDPSDRRNDIYVHNDWMTLGHDGEAGGKVYEGDLYNSGDAKIYVSYTHFKRAADNNWLVEETGGQYKDYKLTFHFTWSGGGRMTLSYDSENVLDINRDPLNWYYEAAYGSGMPKAPFMAEEDATPESGTYYEINDIPAREQVYYDVNLNDSDVRKLMKYGMWVTGGNADLNSILLRSPISVSGVEEVEEENLMDDAIDFNEPYEAYTIDGRRVADVEAPGLYVVRQGTKVVKIMKR